MVRCSIGQVVTRPCDSPVTGRVTRSPVSVNAPEVRPESTGRRGRFRLCRPRGRLPSMFDTLAVAQQLDRQRAVKGPAGLLAHAPGT